MRTSELPSTPSPPLPVAISARKAATLSAIRMKVAGALAKRPVSPTPRTTRVRWLAHSGQRIPTGVGVMQSGQIGRPQDEQETRGLAVGVSVTGLRHRGSSSLQSAAAWTGIPAPARALRDPGRRRRSSSPASSASSTAPPSARPGEVDDVLGLFAVNGWHNVLHILTGALGLLVAGYAARHYALWLGVALPRRSPSGASSLGSGESILGFLPVNTGDNLLHLVLGALGVAAALAHAASGASPGAAATA